MPHCKINRDYYLRECATTRMNLTSKSLGLRFPRNCRKRLSSVRKQCHKEYFSSCWHWCAFSVICVKCDSRNFLWHRAKKEWQCTFNSGLVAWRRNISCLLVNHLSNDVNRDEESERNDIISAARISKQCVTSTYIVFDKFIASQIYANENAFAHRNLAFHASLTLVSFQKFKNGIMWLLRNIIDKNTFSSFAIFFSCKYLHTQYMRHIHIIAHYCLLHTYWTSYFPLR